MTSPLQKPQLIFCTPTAGTAALAGFESEGELLPLLPPACRRGLLDRLPFCRRGLLGRLALALCGAARLPAKNMDLPEHGYDAKMKATFLEANKFLYSRSKAGDAAGRGTDEWRKVYEAPDEGSAAAEQLKNFRVKCPDGTC